MAAVVGNIVFILLLVLANAFFVAAEFALVKVRSSQLQDRIQKGHRRAVLAKSITEHIDSYLSATQLGITLSSLGLGWSGEPFLAEMLRRPLALLGVAGEASLGAFSFALGFGILTVLHIVLGELAPKRIAIAYAEPAALMLSLPLQVFYRVFTPAIWFLNGCADLLLKTMGVLPQRMGEHLHSPEELEIMVAEGAKRGMFNKTEQELITSIFEFSTTIAKEVMIPRTDVVAVDIGTPREKLIRIVSEEGYSRIPVFKETIDNIVGIVYTKDLITLLEHRDLIVLQDIIRPAHFVPESVKISQLMRDLQQRKIHIAVVVDEFGGTEGIITMEDILEEIVGEIHDEYDEVLKDVEHATDGSALVNARIGVREFNEKFQGVIPDAPEYETLNGFLSTLAGRIPELQEEIRFKDLQFTVLKKTQRRIRQVKVTRISPPPEGL